jgi:uncharacterized protein (DUF1501 family)
MKLDRRLFLLGSSALLARPSGARPTRAATGRTLVLLQLSGGNDGLSTLVPYADDVYLRARRATRLEPDEVLRLDERVGLHPSLAGLRKLHGEGRLALVEGVGYPDASRSHFRSLDIWHAADARGRGLGTGWVARAVERLEGSPSGVSDGARPHAVVHFGPRPPFSLHSARRAPVCLTPLLLRSTLGEDDERPVESDSAALARLRASMHATEAALDELRAALANARPHPYPGSRIAGDLRQAAALIHAELGVRVVSLELDGFDTHREQRGRQARLLAELDQALAALYADLDRSEAGRETLVLVFSEFGRRVEENASGGTDHGAAGLAFALGARVRGGLHGRPPALDALDDGDLAFTTDFRSLYASCLRHVFGLEPGEILGGEFPRLDFV